MDRQNVLFYFTDQQRWDTCGCYGQKLPVSPRLDAFASDGVLFEQAITCQPVCGPARAVLQTGRWPAQIGCHVNGRELPQDIPTLAKAFRKAGYVTGYCGKWHLASTDGVADFQRMPVPPERRGGFSDFWIASDVLEFTSHGYGGKMFCGDGTPYFFDSYRADAVADAALAFLMGSRDRSRPFFLFVSQLEPHHQNDRGCFEGPIGSKERFAGFEIPGDLQGTEGDWRENYPDYLGACNRCDWNFGRLLDALAQTGELDHTLVVYTSDHGCHFRTRNAEYKRSCHEGSVHIPMVLRGPGFRGGKRIAAPVSLIDLPITLLDACGIPRLPHMSGSPLTEAIAGRREDVVYLQISESHLGRAIRTSRWKYEVGAPENDGWRDAEATEYMECYLYDLVKDPCEKHNLINDLAYTGIRSELAELMKEQMRKAGEACPLIRPMEQEGFLERIERA